MNWIEDLKESIRAFQDAIYYDSIDGEAGTAWPVGSAAHPVDNHDDFMTILAANAKINTVHVRGVLTFESGDTVPMFTRLIGRTQLSMDSIICPAGVTITQVSFYHLAVDLTNSDCPAGANYYECLVGFGPTKISNIWNSRIADLQPTAGWWFNVDVNDWGLDLSALTSQLYIYGLTGIVELTGQTTGTVRLYCKAGASVTIAASCVGGTINIFGSANVTDNGGGVTVNNYSTDEVLKAILDTSGVLVNARTAAFEKLVGILQTKATTIDLQQIAASYDLFTGTTQDVMLEKLVIRLPNVDVSDDATITSISIQTDDVTPQVIIDATAGGVGNLTAEAQLAWTGAILIKTGTKIQLTIATGAADAPTVCDVVAECRAVLSGGYLA